MGSPQTLSEAERWTVAAWAADCAERVLPFFEAEAPGDSRPYDAIVRTRAFARGELDVAEQIRRRFACGGAARGVGPAAAAAVRAAGQASAIPHMGAHVLAAAAYAAKAMGLAAPDRPAERLAGSSQACPTRSELHYGSCRRSGRIGPGHSGQAFSLRAFLARSSVIFRLVWRAPTAELLRAALPLALTVQATRLVPLTAHSKTVGAGFRMPVQPRMQGWPVSLPSSHVLLLYACWVISTRLPPRATTGNRQRATSAAQPLAALEKSASRSAVRNSARAPALTSAMAEMHEIVASRKHLPPKRAIPCQQAPLRAPLGRMPLSIRACVWLFTDAVSSGWA